MWEYPSLCRRSIHSSRSCCIAQGLNLDDQARVEEIRIGYKSVAEAGVGDQTSARDRRLETGDPAIRSLRKALDIVVVRFTKILKLFFKRMRRDRHDRRTGTTSFLAGTIALITVLVSRAWWGRLWGICTVQCRNRSVKINGYPLMFRPEAVSIHIVVCAPRVNLLSDQVRSLVFTGNRIEIRHRCWTVSCASRHQPLRCAADWLRFAVSRNIPAGS